MKTLLFTLGMIYLILIILSLVITLLIKFDKDHKADINSWHYRLFTILKCSEIYDTPRNVCIYFWEYVLYILFMPFRLPIIIINLFISDKMDSLSWFFSFLFWLIITLSSGIGSALFTEQSPFLKFIYGLTFLILFVLITIGIVILGNVIIHIIQTKRRDNYVRHDNLLKIKLKSWKERNCPLITWKK